jgi:hypothetical protein
MHISYTLDRVMASRLSSEKLRERIWWATSVILQFDERTHWVSSGVVSA